MANELDGGLYFKTGLNLSGLEADKQAAINKLKAIGDAAANEGSRIDSVLSNVARGVAAAFTVGALKEFTMQIVNTRSEMQALETSFKVLLGSKSEADRMISEMKQYALDTPFGMREIADAGKLMLAFNIDAERVMPTLKQIGDISMGNVNSFKSLTLAFSQMSSTGKLMGQDLLQMINAGFNPLAVISKQTGQSIGELKVEMEKGLITSERVAKAYEDAASAGGQFNGMLEQQAEGIQGLQAEIEDGLLNMYNEIGEANQDLIVSGLEMTSSLIKNYRQIGEAIATLVVAYGTYKASIVAYNAVEKIHAAYLLNTETIRKTAIISGNALSASQIAGAAATKTATSAFSGLNLAMSLNPAVAVAAVLTTVAYTMYRVATSTTEAEDRLSRINDALSTASREAEKETLQLDRMYDALNKASVGTDEYAKARQRIIDTYGTQIAQMQGENREVWNLADAYNQLKESALQAANARAYQKLTASADERFGNIIADEKDAMYRALLKHYKGDRNKALGDARYINEVTGKSGTVPDAFLSQFGKISSSSAGVGAPGQMVVDNAVERAVKNIATAVKNNRAELELAQALTGINPNDLASTDGAPKPAAAPKAPPLSDSERNRLEREQANARRKRLEQAQQIKELAQEQISAERLAQLEIDEARLALLDEGYEKEQEKIRLTTEKLKIENANRLKEMIKSQADLARVEWERDNPEKMKKGEIFDPTGITSDSLTQAQRDRISEYLKIAADLELKSKNEVNIKLIEEFGTFEDKRLAITEKYAKLRADLEASKQDTPGRMQVIDDKEKAELDKLQDTYNKVSSSIQLARINIERAAFRAAMEQRKSFTPQADALDAELKARKEALEAELKAKEAAQKANPTENDIANLERLRFEQEKLNRELELMPIHRMQELSDHVKNISGSLAGLGGIAGDIFGSMGGAIDSITSGLSLAKSGGSVDYGALASQAVESTVNVINMVTEATKRRKAAEAEFYKNSIAMAHEYSLALNNQLRTQADMNGGGFVTDYQGRINSGFAAMTDAANSYEEALLKLGEGRAKVSLSKAVDWGNVGKGALQGLTAGASVGTMILPGLGTLIGGAVGAVGGFFAGLFGGKKAKEEVAGLLEVFPDLVDASGNFNSELAEVLINTEQLDDKTTQLVQNALDWENALEEARDTIRGIVTDLAGDLGNNIREALVTAFETGGDAGKLMFDQLNGSLEGFLEQLLYSTVFSDLFSDFSDRIVDSLDPKSGDQNIIDDFDWLLDGLEDRGEIFNELLRQAQERAAERGFELWKPDETSRTAAVGGFAQASQDSVLELNGRMTAVQLNTFNTAENTRLMNISLNEILVLMQGVKGDTARLSEISATLNDVANTLNSLDLYGIKIK